MKKALILIDYINDICHTNGKIAGCAAMFNEKQIVYKVNQLLDYVRQKNWLIVWITVGFSKNYAEASSKSQIFAKAKAVNALQQQSWGCQLIANLNYQENETIICKNAVNPFYATNLDHILRVNQIEELYLAGVSTEVAIQSCTRDAHDRGYLVNIIADCCASGNLHYHEASLAMLQNMAKIVESEHLIKD